MQRIAPHKTSIFVHIAIYLLVFQQTEGYFSKNRLLLTLEGASISTPLPTRAPCLDKEKRV